MRVGNRYLKIHILVRFADVFGVFMSACGRAPGEGGAFGSLAYDDSMGS